MEPVVVTYDAERLQIKGFDKTPARKKHVAHCQSDPSPMNFRRHIYTNLMRPLSYDLSPKRK